MLFNSFEFFIFFVVVLILYFLLNHRWQNRMLLVASYVFYGFWDWRFLFLMAISTITDFFVARKIEFSEDRCKRKLLLLLSIVVNLSILGFFKYCNFFVENFIDLMGLLGVHLNAKTFNIILPMGISFYTFQTMSYTIDVYRRKMQSTDHFFDFALFVSFFPQLVAGPIERASRLLPQVLNPRKVTLDDFYQGSFLVFWGLFLKVFIADNMAKIVDPVFLNHSNFGGQEILMSIYAFAFQIFCDFAGYSNIARGTARMMGFHLIINFNLPYFATNPSDFWRRWHISLSSWLRDYLYIPLGGNRLGTVNTYRNLFLTMLLGGLWHGASWTFVVWGAYHGLLLVLYRISQPVIPRVKNKIGNIVLSALKMIFFFHLVCFGWMLFRSQSLGQVGDLLHVMVSQFEAEFKFEVWKYFFGPVSVLIFIQLLQYWKNDLMAPFKLPLILRSVFYVICFYLILFFGVEGGKEFIYFQF